MKSFFFHEALFPSGWSKDVRIDVDEKGTITSSVVNSMPNENDEIINCAIPAMPNCHSHVFQRTMAGLTEYKTSENDSFWSWRNLMYEYANKINSEQLYHIARYVYHEMLLCGYSSVCEFHYIHRELNNPEDTNSMSQAIIQAAHDAGIELTLLPVLYQQSHVDGTPLTKSQERFYLSNSDYIELYQSLEKQLYECQKLGICFHSLRAVSIENMQIVLDELGNNHPIHIHISEQVAEVEQLLEHTNMRPVEYLFHNFEVNSNWSLIHATHLNDNEINLIAKSGAIAGLCPMTEANLGDGVLPLPEYFRQNGKIAIGSDSHIVINPFQELQILEYSQRLQLRQRVVSSNSKTSHVGTFLWNNAVSGSKLSGQFCGNGFNVGDKANWIEIDTHNPLLTNLNGEQCLDTLVFVDSNAIASTYINAHKTEKQNDKLIENYKKTLKLLR